jgi:hypothetical protein
LSNFFLEPDAFWNASLWKSALRWALYLFLTNYGPLQILKDVGTWGICVMPLGCTKRNTLTMLLFKRPMDWSKELRKIHAIAKSKPHLKAQLYAKTFFENM